MPRKLTTTWSYFKKININNKNRAECMYCAKIYYYNATRMAKHILTCEKCPENVKNVIKRDIKLNYRNKMTDLKHEGTEAPKQPEFQENSIDYEEEAADSEPEDVQEMNGMGPSGSPINFANIRHMEQHQHQQYMDPHSQILPEDSFDWFGKVVAVKLRSMQSEQALISEKIINEVLFEGQMCTLNRGSTLVVNPHAADAKPSFSFQPVLLPTKIEPDDEEEDNYVTDNTS